MKTFFYPSLQFLQRTDQLLKSDWTIIDDSFRPLYKKTLGLPSNAANEYLYGRKEDGLIGIPLAAEDSDIAHIDGGFKLLTSRDKIIKNLAWGELTDIANWRFESTNQSNIENYLNSAPSSRTSDKFKSQWSKARQATKRLGINWAVNDREDIELKVGDEFVKERRGIFRAIRKYLRITRTISLRNHPHQGKTNTCVAAARSSCHFFTDGKYTTFKDWRFIHRARLGLFSNLNAYNHASGHNNKNCRRCPKLETLPHVLNHCMKHSTLYKRRHNAVVERIKKAAMGRWIVIGEDQVVGTTNNRRPDLVLRKGNDIMILDITCPFENGLQAFQDARKEKEDKYAELAAELSSDGTRVRVDAIIVGSLGSWDPQNDKIIRRLCSEKYAKTMRKIIVSETISYSQDVFSEHMRAVPQNSGGRLR